MYANGRSALSSTINTIKRDIEEICQSGNYYVTEEIGSTMNKLANGLDHLKLDGYLISTSADWKKGYDPQQIRASNANAMSALETLGATLFDYKSKMGNTSISQCQENEIRERHNWAMNSLNRAGQELSSYTHGAADRIKQFGDHIGVTDRYTGYRNNLTRGSREPFKLATSWMDKNTQGGYLMNGFGRSHTMADIPLTKSQGAPPSASGVRFGASLPAKVDTKGYQTIDSIFPRSQTMVLDSGATLNPQLTALKTANAANALGVGTSNQPGFVSLPRGHKNLSIQEQAGINTTFPGRTEYMTRYKSPITNVKTSDFVVNPTPNFLLHGRPLGLTTYTPSFTEYQTRYEWPDGNRIVKLPWRRS